jgi:putative component of membrane protein insertase Oxa1/YidC/SpoIIIJ protein YidD
MSCGPWFSGTTVVMQDGALRTCRVSNGRVFTCGPWFQGEAVLPE